MWQQLPKIVPRDEVYEKSDTVKTVPRIKRVSVIKDENCD